MSIKPNRWSHVGFVKSETDPNKVYEIKKNLETGKLGCNCQAWIRNVNNAQEEGCKHIKSIKGKIDGFEFAPEFDNTDLDPEWINQAKIRAEKLKKRDVKEANEGRKKMFDLMRKGEL